MRDAIDRAGRVAAAHRRRARCRPTTTRCCAASWRCSPTGAWPRECGVALERRAAGDLADGLRPARRQRAGAAGGRRAPRLHAAQPDGAPSRTPASSTSRTRCAARSATTSPRCCATPSSRWDEEHEIDWAVRYWEQARKAGLPVDARLRRVLARARMDGPAAPPEGARHLLPPEAPRRQAAATARTCRASSATRQRVCNAIAAAVGACSGAAARAQVARHRAPRSATPSCKRAGFRRARLISQPAAVSQGSRSSPPKA